MLDLRNPTLVIVGFWNQAILSEPAWIARHVLGKSVGDSFEVGQLVVGGQAEPQKIVHLYDEFAISCTHARLEVFVRSIDAFESARNAVKIICEKLPYTPVASFGLNFTFIHGDATGVAGPLDTAEDLTELGERLEIRRIDVFDLRAGGQEQAWDGPLLNFERRTNFEKARFDFNYHHSISDSSSVIAWLDSDCVERWRDLSRTMLRTRYGVEDAEEASFWDG